MNKYSILIVEDHSLTRFGLKTAFETEENIINVFEAPNAQIAFDIIEKETIDIVIMDLGLPDIDGLEATKVIKQKHPKIKIIILSSHENGEEVIKSLRAGAASYCTKDIEPEKLIYTVDSVMKGAAWFDPKVAKYVLNAIGQADFEKIQIAPNEEATPITNNEINLTSREKQVLALIADGSTNNEIAQKLNVSINTTKVHVCKILQKLSVNDRTQAAIKAMKNNLI